jgi:hypothetical protein
MNVKFVASLAGGAVLAVMCGAGPALAHHSYAMFDRTKKQTIQGTIAKYEFTNPHVYIWLYVKNAQGKYDTYAIEGGSSQMLARAGWSGTTVVPGEKVTIDYNPLKDGRTGGYFVHLTKADGTQITGDGAAGQGNGRLPGGAGEAQKAEEAEKAKAGQ